MEEEEIVLVYLDLFIWQHCYAYKRESPIELSKVKGCELGRRLAQSLKHIAQPLHHIKVPFVTFLDI